MENMKFDSVVFVHQIVGTVGLPEVFYKEKLVIRKDSMSYSINHLINQPSYKDYETHGLKLKDYSWKIKYRDMDDLVNHIRCCIDYNEEMAFRYDPFNEYSLYICFRSMILGKSRLIMYPANSNTDKEVFSLIKELFEKIKVPEIETPWMLKR